jgi:hypothetical protein
MRKGWSILIALAFLFGLAWSASAGVLSVRVPTKSGIEARFGMVELFTVNWAKNYDFYDDASDPAWFGDPEGYVRDNYMSHMVYFPVDFVKEDQWRAHMLFSYKMSDFDQGKDYNRGDPNLYGYGIEGGDSDRWRVERAYFEFKLNFLGDVNAWVGVGHEFVALDGETGALVYFDDDPGIVFYGNYKKFSWNLQFLRKAEQTDSQAFETDSNRDVYWLKLKYDFGPYAKPFIFGAWDYNGAMYLANDVVNDEDDPASVIDRNIDDGYNKGTWSIYYAGLGMTGKIGPVMYQMEGVYQGGDSELRGDGMLMPDGDYEDEFDYSSWAGLVNFQVDLAQWIPALNKFVVGLGGVYFSGDDDADDDDLEGFTGITSATRFFKPWGMGTLPVHGVNQQPLIGNHIYAWTPATSWGIGPFGGGVLGRGNDYGANPGLIAGVFTIDWTPIAKWNVKVMVKYLEWDDTDVIETQLGDNDIGWHRFPYAVDPDEVDYNPDDADDIDEEIGWETDLMVSYKIYPNVTLFGGISALWPGDGIDDINEVLYDDDDSDVAWHGQLGVKFVF